VSLLFSFPLKRPFPTMTHRRNERTRRVSRSVISLRLRKNVRFCEWHIVTLDDTSYKYMCHCIWATHVVDLAFWRHVFDLLDMYIWLKNTRYVLSTTRLAGAFSVIYNTNLSLSCIYITCQVTINWFMFLQCPFDTLESPSSYPSSQDLKRFCTVKFGALNAQQKCIASYIP